MLKYCCCLYLHELMLLYHGYVNLSLVIFKNSKIFFRLYIRSKKLCGHKKNGAPGVRCAKG